VCHNIVKEWYDWSLLRPIKRCSIPVKAPELSLIHHCARGCYTLVVLPRRRSISAAHGTGNDPFHRTARAADFSAFLRSPESISINSVAGAALMRPTLVCQAGERRRRRSHRGQLKWAADYRHHQSVICCYY